MNELQNEQLNRANQTITELKARLYDAAGQLEQQTSMMGVLAEKIGFKGQTFEELLKAVDEIVSNKES